MYEIFMHLNTKTQTLKAQFKEIRKYNKNLLNA